MASPINVKKQTQCRNNIAKDFSTGVLKREDGIEVFGFHLSQDRYVYNSVRNKDKTGQELTLGELKDRYCIDGLGDLRSMNRFFVGTVDERGTSLETHYPSESNASKVNIPPSLIEKTLDVKS